jgi:hypothetical protein
VLKATTATDERFKFLHTVAASLVVVMAVDLFFSFAAYGLSEPYWYFFGGLSVVTVRLATRLSQRRRTEVPVPQKAGLAGARDYYGRRRRLGVLNTGSVPRPETRQP